MSPRPDVSKERTRQILDAAVKVFSRSGFQKASMDDIVAESGLSKGALYWYFKSKDEIIVAVLDHLFAGELIGVQQLAQGDGSAEGRLVEFSRITISEIKNMMRLVPITYEFYSLAFRNKIVQKSLRKYFQNYIDALTPVIEQGMARGEFRRVDARETAITLAAIVEGSLLLWVFDPKMVQLEAQLEMGVRLVLEGLKTDGKSKSKA